MNKEKMISKFKLGVFDSGVGGFSVLKELRKKTSADVLYYGDCARAPYGNRSKDEIQSFIKEIICLLQAQNVTHFVSACNSMSVVTTNKILDDCAITGETYIDMLRAFNEYSVFPSNAHVMIIGTQATVTSGAYQESLKERQINSYEYIFKTLAGSIEKGEDKNVMYEIIKPMILYAKEIGVTYIIYGCTHYPLIDDLFKLCANDMNWRGDFIDPSVYVAEAVSKWNLQGSNVTDFQASESTNIFIDMSNNYI